jgi:hypothetical protein
MSTVKFQVWAHEEPSMGGGTLTATVECDLSKHRASVPFAKRKIAFLFAELWDQPINSVQVMTQEEFDFDPHDVERPPEGV